MIEERKDSTVQLQRRLKIGYNRACRLIDQLEKEGVIAPFKGVHPREVLLDKYESNGKKIKEIAMKRDPLFEDAKRVIEEYEKASVPLLQRKLRIGWNRAARLFEELKKKGFIK